MPEGGGGGATAGPDARRSVPIIAQIGAPRKAARAPHPTAARLFRSGLRSRRAGAISRVPHRSGA